MKQELSASKVFSSMSVFDMLRGQLHMAFYTISSSVQAKVSLDRVNDFLHNVSPAFLCLPFFVALTWCCIRQTELLDSFSEKEDVVGLFAESTHVDRDAIGFRNASFSWSNDTDGAFLLKVEEELLFQRKSINLIIGPTGSGKTSLLMALLGVFNRWLCGFSFY